MLITTSSNRFVLWGRKVTVKVVGIIEIEDLDSSNGAMLIVRVSNGVVVVGLSINYDGDIEAIVPTDKIDEVIDLLATAKKFAISDRDSSKS